MTRTIKIVADGEPTGTRILAGDVDISDRISRIAWMHEAGKIPLATVTLALFPLTLEARVHYVAPDGRKIKYIVYEDDVSLESAGPDIIIHAMGSEEQIDLRGYVADVVKKAIG